MKMLEGHLGAQGLKFGIVISRFNEFVTGKLLDGAKDALIRHGASEDDITVMWVPGAFEIPPVARKAAEKGHYDAVICLGAVIRGDTPHFDYIAAETTKGIAMASFDCKIPVAYGIITADTLEQAIERSGSKAGNKGWDAACSAIEMADLYRKLEG
jgi:6,7-dimethyl-8-ribityllumazine synthase